MVVLGIDPGYGRVGYGVIDYTKNKYKGITPLYLFLPEPNWSSSSYNSKRKYSNSFQNFFRIHFRLLFTDKVFSFYFSR